MLKRTRVLWLFGFFAFLAHSQKVRSEGVERRAIIFWHKEEGEQEELLRRIFFDFSESTGIKVQLEGFADLGAMLLKAGRRGQLPDVVMAAGDYVGFWRQLKFSKVERSAFRRCELTAIRRLLKREGRFYGVPLLAGNQLLLFYNRRYLERPLERWSELWEHPEKFSHPGVKPIAWDYQQPYYLYAFSKPFGVHLDFSRPDSSNEEGLRRLFRYYKAILEKSKVPSDCDRFCSSRRFSQGEFAMTLGGDWAYQEMKMALGDALGVASLPETPEGPMRSLMLGTALFFPNDSLNGPRKESLKKLITFLLSDKQQERWAAAGRLPLLSRKSSFRLFERPNQKKTTLEGMSETTTLETPERMIYLWPVLHKALRVYLRSGVDLESVLKRMDLQARSGVTACNGGGW